MRWGKIECLKDFTRILRLHNTGLIPATMQVFLRLAHSKFSLKNEVVLLSAGETYNLEVTANLDDSLVTTEELHIMVEEGTCSKRYFRIVKYICLCVIFTIFYELTHLLTPQFITIRARSTVQYRTVQNRTVQYRTEQYSTVQYSTVQYSTVQYSTVEHGTA